MKTSVLLKSCPFCGGKAEFIQQGAYYAFKVRCTSCGATVGGTAFRNDKFNAEMWNKRAPGKLETPPEPVYDDVYYEGVKWLDTL